ncbi:MAG: GIY-YIG nuclease family protein [Paludibacter sp.]|nr:GIY-YIG nuclease family protein [Bacteroidales bacterium]MCM1069027.1 GIY-YIG nuclease family protein [Prevotella sp.]MCM1353690.1 GIY-YIG nuclease family protein [Bacteroides sp.]MCM1441961.1 GIY-YIG nuclease family protein [Muribaculum sp.]MCM1481583.1 GIY-YIG nuclease family protein [Paludibacter sp.]
MEKGYVYILTNPSFREDWVKIGKSSRPVNVRSKELDNTAVPLPFEIYATIETVKYNEVEKHVHKTIDRLSDLRVRQNREFFNIAPQVALDILIDIAKMIDDSVITKYKNNAPILITTEEVSLPEINDEERTQRHAKPRFKFSMIGIEIGEMVVFDPIGLEVRVASDNQVEYNGRLYKLSPFVGTFMPEERRNISGAYQGSKYFSYKGRILDDIRKEYEECNRQ